MYEVRTRYRYKVKVQVQVRSTGTRFKQVQYYTGFLRVSAGTLGSVATLGTLVRWTLVRLEPAVTRRKVQVQVRGTGTDSLYGLDKHLVWVYKSVVRQKLVKTFDSYGFKFLMVKAEYLTLTFFSVPRTDCKSKLQVRLSAERPSCHINLPIRARDK